MRKVFFWMHLIAGTIGGVVIFIMSVTGALLMYEKQMLYWADTREIRIDAPAPSASRLPVEELVARVRDQRQALPTTVAIRSEPNAPLMLAYGREGAVFVNPYTGAVAGTGAQGLRDFFRVVTDWHRWLGAGEEDRVLTKAITGACNLAFLFLVMSGIYIWLPRAFTWQHLRPVVWFKRGLSGKARDFNWHNAIGIWCVIPLFFVVLGATVISYPWASNLAYRVAGSEPPPAGAKGGLAKGEGKKKGGKKGGPQRAGPAAVPAPPIDLNLEGMDAAWKKAEAQVAGWKAITLRLPASDRAPWSFTVDEGYAGQPQLRGTLTVARNGEVERWETFESFDAGRRFRTWLRFVHTGEYYGLTGQTIAGIASAGGAVLVYTGLALAWRRYWGWRERRKRAATVAETVAA